MTRKAKAPAPAGASPVPEMAVRYVAAVGSPFSDDDAEIIGIELLRIAKQNAVDDVRSLDDAFVYSIIENNDEHPLRKYLEWDDEKAARKHRIQQTGVMRRSVRVINLSLGERAVPTPMFLHVPDYARRSESVVHERKHVLTDDVLRSDPAFASACSAQIKLIRHALERLEHVTSMRPSPVELVQLAADMRYALDSYMSGVAKTRAA